MKKIEFSKQFKEKLTAYLLGGFGLVAALAWNDAVKTLIDSIFPISTSGIILKFLYAILMTLLIVLVSILLAKDDNKK